METQTANLSDVFQDLRGKVCYGSSSRADTMFGSGIRGEDLIMNTVVPNQLVALPGHHVDARIRLRIAQLAENVLVVQYTVRWTSVYGLHESVAAYLVTLNGEQITITPKWQQTVPTPTLDHIEIHTGGVTAADYHQKVLDWLRANGVQAANQMLFDGKAKRIVADDEFVALAALIMPWPLEF